MGILLSFVTAVLASLHDSFINASSKKENEFVVALASTLFSFPIILLALFWTGIPEVNIYFWGAVILKAPLGALASLYRSKAHRMAEQSLIVPMLCLTPVFVMLMALILLQQAIKPLGILGVSVMVVGMYSIQIGKRHKGFFEPFKALYREAGVRYMLLVAFIWSFTATLDGVGVVSAGSVNNDIFLSFKAGVFWLICTQGLASILLFMVVARKRLCTLEEMEWKILISIGVSNGFQELTQMCAMGLAPAAYVISIKRLSVIFSSIIGFLYFHEKGAIDRLPGIALMVFGFVLITLSK